MQSIIALLRGTESEENPDALYGICDLEPFARLDVSSPPVIQHRASRWSDFPNRATSDEIFAKSLHRMAPCLMEFDLQRYKLVLAGGAASRILMHGMRVTTIGDYDMFLVGHTSDDTVIEAITALGDHLHKCLGEKVIVYRTQGCVTYYGQNGITIQVILCRGYSTIGDVIRGFDLGSCAVAWDGSRVYLTSLGKFAAERGANILNLATRSSSFETRIARYFERGFDLVLPGFNGDLMKLEGRLPYLFAQGINRDRDGRLTAHALHAIQMSHPVRPATVGSHYYNSYPIPYGNDDDILMVNIQAIEGPSATAICASATYVPGLDIREVGVDLDIERLSTKVQRTLDDLYAVNLVKMKTLLGAYHSAILILSCIIDEAQPSPEMVKIHCTARVGELEERARKIPFIITKNGDSSFGGGVRLTAAEWYGESA